MTETELRTEMEKLFKECFNAEEIINFTFEIAHKFFEKGVEIGMKINQNTNTQIIEK